MPTTRTVTFDHLCRLEPRLLDLKRAVIARGHAAYRKRNWCANAAWYAYGKFTGRTPLKEWMSRLVGFYRTAAPGSTLADEEEALLRSTHAYDVAYRALYELLPDCRVCGCL